MKTRTLLLSTMAMVAAVASSPMGVCANSRAYVVLGGAPQNVTVFRLPESRVVAPFFVPNWGNNIAVDPGSKQIWEATSHGLNVINILDPVSGDVIDSITLSPSQYLGIITFDPQGKNAYVLAGAGPTQLLQFDVASRALLHSISVNETGDSYTAIGCSPDGSRILLATFDQSLLLLDARDLSVLRSGVLTEVVGAVNSIFFVGRQVLLSAGSNLVYLDGATLAETMKVALPSTNFLFGIRSSRVYLASTCCKGDFITVLDLTTGTTLQTQQFDYDLSYIALSEDGSKIMVISDPGAVLDSQTLAQTETFAVPQGPDSVWFAGNSAYMLNGGNGNDGSGGGVAVVDEATAALVDVFSLGSDPGGGTVLSPNHQSVLVGSAGNANLIDTQTNKVVSYLPYYEGFSPSALGGGKIYGGYGGDAAVYDPQTKELQYLPVPSPPLNTLLVGISLGYAPADGRTFWFPFVLEETPPDGLRNASGSITGGILIYDSAKAEIKHMLFPPPGNWQIAFSPDLTKAYIVVDGGLAIYDAQSFRAIGNFQYSEDFSAIQISPDGSRIYASESCGNCGANGNAIHVLDAITGGEIESLPLPFTAPTSGAGLAVSSDGTTLFLLSPGMNSIVLMNASTGAITETALPYTPQSITVVP